WSRRQPRERRVERYAWLARLIGVARRILVARRRFPDRYARHCLSLSYGFGVGGTHICEQRSSHELTHGKIEAGTRARGVTHGVLGMGSRLLRARFGARGG